MMVVSDSSGSNVEKTDATTLATAEDKNNEPTLQVLEGGTSTVPVEVPTEVAVDILEQTQSVGSEYIPQLKRSEELAQELTLSEEILEQIVAQVGGTVEDITDIPAPPPPKEEVRSKVEEKTSEEGPKELEVAFPDFLHDSVVPLLKYLDKKRGKYIVRRESGSYVELVRSRIKFKSAVVVKRKWNSATAMTKERVASLTAECATTRATL